MWLATITENEIVRVWDLETGPQYSHEYVKQAAFHPDGRRVMTAGDFEVKVWDVAAGKSLSLTPRSQIYQASVSPDGQRIATASEDGLVRIWNASTGTEVQSLRHGRRARNAVFNPDRRTLASAGQVAGRHEVAVWDLATGEKSLVLPHGNSYITQIEFSPDGSRLLTVGSDAARVWDVGKGQEISGLQMADVDRATFDPHGTRLAMVHQRTNILVLDAATGRRLFPPLRPDNFRITALAFASGGSALVIATESGLARIWDSGTGKPMTPPLGLGPGTHVRHAAVSPDGRFLATGGSNGSARIWDVATGQPLTPPLSHPGGVVHVAFSPDSLRLVTIGDGMRQWDLSRDATRGTDAELALLAQLLSARRIDSTGAVSPLSLDEIRTAWASRVTR
jgi:WD40 repeat protein